MHIGIDFDNTIVSYDALFYKVALEGGYIPAELPRTKISVRDHLRKIDKEDIWTEMQGYVYGARMEEAMPFPGVVEFIQWARTQGIEVSIISHKTRHPFIGTRYDLHEAARQWVQARLVDGGGALQQDHVYYEVTKEDKLQRIDTSRCDYFIDDLPEILRAEGFPSATEAILFDPEGHHADEEITTLHSWTELRHHFEQRCKTVS